MTDLASIEAAHGFRFGNPTSDTGTSAPPVASLVCNAPTCTHRGSFVQIHADTILPVHCGGCAGVLHCQHDEQTRTERAGTVGDALEHTITACRICGTETQPRVTKPLGSLLHQLPANILDQPL